MGHTDTQTALTAVSVSVRLMVDERAARIRLEDVEGFVCEGACDSHQTMAQLDDARRWEAIHKPGEAQALRLITEPLEPPAAATLYRCKRCGWETTNPRTDSGPWAD